MLQWEVKTGGADILYGDDGDLSTTGNGDADSFILGSNTLATAVDYNPDEGDIIIQAPVKTVKPPKPTK
jgi:hypothetical protein